MARPSGDSRSPGKPKRRSAPLQTYLRYRMLKRLTLRGSVVLLLVVISLADRGGCLPAVRGHRPGHFQSRTYTVVAVIDGDTIDVADSLDPQENIRVRLWGMDTPELAKQLPDKTVVAPQPLAQEAKQFTERLCLEKTVTLSVQAHRLRGRFGRLLAYVHLPDGTVLNERLLAAGLARADDRFEHDHFKRYDLLQQQAQFDRVGLWGP